MNLKMLQVFRITFKKDKTGMISKNYEGIIKPENYNDIESGISMVIQHIYQEKMNPEQCFEEDCINGNLLEIVFSKNVMGNFNVKSMAAEITTNDCENVLTGLGEILMRLHLERMAKEEIKITLNKDGRTSLIDYTPESKLV